MCRSKHIRRAFSLGCSVKAIKANNGYRTLILFIIYFHFLLCYLSPRSLISGTVCRLLSRTRFCDRLPVSPARRTRLVDLDDFARNSDRCLNRFELLDHVTRRYVNDP